MHRLIPSFALLAGACLALAPALPAGAVVLVPGEQTQLTGTSVAERPELAGTVLADELRPFSIGLTGGDVITGQIQDRVVRSDAGTLDFYLRVQNDASSDRPLGVGPGGGCAPAGSEACYALVFAFANDGPGFTYDVDFRTDGLGADASAGVLAAQGFFIFDLPALAPGESSSFYFVHTDATAFEPGINNGLLVNGAGEGLAAGAEFSHFQPVRAVPLPAAWLLFGAGLAGLMPWLRRGAKA